MKKTFVIILSLVGFLAFGQENKTVIIQNEVNLIETDSTLAVTEFDLTQLTGITTDGGGILQVWRNNIQICKIVEEVGLSYGRIRTIVYLKNELPIKIIDTEENFGFEDGEVNYKELNLVFKQTIYVFDWKNNKSKINQIGKRVVSDKNSSIYERVKSIIVQVKRTTAK